MKKKTEHCQIPLLEGPCLHCLHASRHWRDSSDARPRGNDVICAIWNTWTHEQVRKSECTLHPDASLYRAEKAHDTANRNRSTGSWKKHSDTLGGVQLRDRPVGEYGRIYFAIAECSLNNNENYCFFFFSSVSVARCRNNVHKANKADTAQQLTASMNTPFMDGWRVRHRILRQNKICGWQETEQWEKGGD